MGCKNKAFATLLLAWALSLGMVFAAFAEGGKQQKRKNVTFAAAGPVTLIDVDASTLTLEIEKAYRLPKGQIGNPVSFAVSRHVKVKTEGSDIGTFDLSFEDMEVSDRVRVLGRKLADGTHLITHIVVHLEE